MRISNTDWPNGQVPSPNGQVPDSRRPAGQARPSVARGRVVAGGASEQPVEPARLTQPQGLRQRILELQRSAAGLQRSLAGLEELRQFFHGEAGGDPPAARAQAAAAHLASVRYRGQALLAPYADRLHGAVLRGDDRVLESTIGELRGALRALAVELSRFETAEQNSRALGGPSDPLASLVEAVRGAGERVLQPDGRSALDLLG